MAKILDFSGLVSIDNKKVATYFVNFNYNTSPLTKCVIDCTIYLKHPGAPEETIYKTKDYNTDIQNVINGENLIKEAIKENYPESSMFYFKIDLEKYLIEQNGKKLYILKDNFRPVQYIQYLQAASTLYSDDTVSIALTFEEIKDKYHLMGVI